MTRARILLLSVLWVISACGDRLPFQEEAIVGFEENRTIFEELIVLFESDNFSAVVHGGINTKVYVRRTGVIGQEPLLGDLANRLRESLDAGGLRRIANDRGSGHYTLVPNGNAIGANPRYFIEYVFGEKAPDAPSCKESRPKGEFGMCIVGLAPNWWLFYSWLY